MSNRKNSIGEIPESRAWDKFSKEAGFTGDILERFKTFYRMIRFWNERFNLTADTRTGVVINRHFVDSLALRRAVPIAEKSVVDVGSGAGFPGIPLKIAVPSLRMRLLEVNGKRAKFLEEAIKILELENTEVLRVDWRTFIRRNEETSDYYIARASLTPSELTRALKPGSRHNGGTVVYWASSHWTPEAEKKLHAPLVREYHYRVKRTLLKLAFFRRVRGMSSSSSSK